MLNIDLNGVTTARPCPQDGEYVVTLTNAVIEQKDKGPMLTITFVTANDILGIPLNDAEAPVIPSGYQINERYRLYDVDNPRAPKFRETLARLVDGVLGTNDGNRPTDFNAALETMLNKNCVLVLKAENDDQYGWQPRVKKVKPLAG